MKGPSSLPLLVLAASACAAGGGAPSSSPGPINWPAGEFVLEGTVTYNEATPSYQGTATEDYVAYLDIADDGSSTLTSSTGLCREPIRARVRRDETVAGRFFECGDVTYFFGPGGGTIRGELSARVEETFRVPGPCRGRGTGADGQSICIRPSWRIDYRTSTKRARLRVSEEAQGGN
jgi:hypothetical protein